MEKRMNLRDLRPEDLRSGKEFIPGPLYNEWGDCLQILLCPDPIRRERIDGLLTIYLSRLTSEIVGFQIKGIKNLVKKYDALRMSIKEGHTWFGFILLALQREACREWPEDKINVLEATYEHLLEEVGGRRLEFPEDVIVSLVAK
jgi:hypothetical protein